ncbi:MAG: cell division protein CrgA [Actinomycetaceae bacterium]|nr:cell division protein CrgA [Actinomycetaceae bacterium]MDU0971109.1 cell division protein CrgA [Actinomycetaceae bacterium]
MPESRKRKNASGHKVQQEDAPLQSSWSDGMKLSPSWWAPVMVTLMVVGLLLVVVTYITGAKYPIPGIGNWNLAVGLGVALVGFLMTMRWK